MTPAQRPHCRSRRAAVVAAATLTVGLTVGGCGGGGNAAPVAEVEQVAEAKARGGNDYSPPRYRLEFADEFSGSELDRSRWCTRYPYSGGPPMQVPDPACGENGNGTLNYLNDEQQRYVDVNALGQPLHVVSGGILKLTATRSRSDNLAPPYESAMIRSKFTFRPDASRSYYVTARLRLPSVRGTWAHYWLTPGLRPDGGSSWPPEIDIVEAALNGREDPVTQYHLGAKQQNWGGTGAYGNPPVLFAAPEVELTWYSYQSATSLRDRWIEFGAEWTDSSICYYLDGRKILCEAYQWLSNDRSPAPQATVIVGLALGGAWAGRYGIDDAALPVSVDVDHVRVYSRLR